MPRPTKPHPRGKLRGFEKLHTDPPEPTPEPDPIPEPGPAPEPPPPPPPPAEPGPVPDHAGLQFPYLYMEGADVAAELAGWRAYLDDVRLWTWEASGGITWYHQKVYADEVYPVDADGNPTIPYGHRGDPNLQWGGFAHYAMDYAGAIWRGYGDHVGGELGMVLFNSRPHEGGDAGGKLGHARHGFWGIDAIMHRPWPEKDTVWQTGLWPNISLGGILGELWHAFGVDHKEGDEFLAAHWNWPNVGLSAGTIAQMEQSPWLARGPRPEVGDWRRWL